MSKLIRCAALTGLAWVGVLACPGAGAQTLTADQLKALLPDIGDLAGFVRVEPPGLTPPAFVRIQPAEEWPPVPYTVRQPKVLEDAVQIGHVRDVPGGGSQRVSWISRLFYTSDGAYRVSLGFTVYERPGLATAQIQWESRRSMVSWEQGGYRPDGPIADESWTHPGGPGGHILAVRVGRVLLRVNGSQSARASREQVKGDFTPEAVQAIAECIFLRLARRPDITGSVVPEVAVSVNGANLPGQHFLLAGRPIVPVLEVARLAGWQATVDDRAGRITLRSSSGSTVTLLAGSREATTGAGTVTMRSAVLKDGGAPVMDVEELAALMGGAVEKAEGRVSVRI